MSETTYNTGITDDQIRAINARAMQAVDRDAELETLRDERDRLREALRPFAERWEYFERTKHPSGGEWPEDLEYADDEPSAIYLGQLKAAKAALTPAGGEGRNEQCRRTNW